MPVSIDKLKDAGLPGRTISELKKRKYATMNDLAQLRPRKYVDYTRVVPVQSCFRDEDPPAAVSGRLLRVQVKYSDKREYLSMRFEQADGMPFFVIAFKGTFMFETYAQSRGMEYIICGKVGYNHIYGYSVMNPDEIVPAERFVPHVFSILPKYSGISEAMLEKAVRTAADYAEDPVPESVVRKAGLWPYRDTLIAALHPADMEVCSGALWRLRFGELFELALGLEVSAENGSESAACICKHRGRLIEYLMSLPYKLTGGQTEVLGTMEREWRAGKRLNALLQGDVGSGKTTVAMAMAAMAAGNGFQTVVMAPRSVLAAQHFKTFSSGLEPVGVHCVFLQSGMKQKERKEILAQIASGEAQVIVGTHSCLSDDVKYHSLGLLIVDEEHLFGVAQKEKLVERANNGVCFISMSATPIPRTLATILYGGHKEILCIRTMPEGRLPIITRAEPDHRIAMAAIRAELKAGHQIYVVCPAIEEGSDLTNVEEISAMYRREFPGARVETLHGKMKREDIETAAREYSAGNVHILVSTTVIEVGIDNPNATVMIIEQAERFGLASLHQLRGRVGRSSLQSYCLLETEDLANPRIRTMVRTNDGFEIAEADLEIRGTGNLIGTEQSGFNKKVNEMILYPAEFEYARGFAREFRNSPEFALWQKEDTEEG